MTTKSPCKHIAVNAEEYLCHVCEEEFFVFENSDPVCPRCGTKNPEDLEKLPLLDDEHDN